MRTNRLLLAASILTGGLALASTGCGPSQLARQYSAYTAEVEPLLEQEAERWQSMAALLQARQDDYASPRYYRFLQDNALPFYTGLHERVTALAPEGERVAAAHAHLVRFVAARLEFVHVEISARETFESAVGEDGLLAVMSGLQEAENLRYEYAEAIGESTPDAKLGELYSIVDSFRQSWFVPLQQGARDPEDVQRRLRAHVIPALEELQRRKYFDTDADRLLKSCVAAWLAWHRKLERACPTLQRVWDVKAKSEAAAQESQESLDAFRQELEAIRRDR
jgi:hypothetical protein